MDADPVALAGWAMALQHRLGALAQDMHPSHRRGPLAAWDCLRDVLDASTRHRMAARLYQALVGPLPPLRRLADPVARVCLLDGTRLPGRLCALALARRPGVLRSCVTREARLPLLEALGSAFDALMPLAAFGRPHSERVLAWTPTHWACLGYIDWVRMLEPDDGPLRRMVRLSLPRELLNMPQLRHHARADMAPAEAVRLMAEHEVALSC